mgnify:CR=1 FL=1
MQDDNISYTILKDKIQEKKSVLNGWLSTFSSVTLDHHPDENSISLDSKMSHTWGPSLSKYIELTSKKTYGAFFVDTKNRQIAEENCRLYVERFLSKLDRRFPVSKVQECLCSLFDPVYLYKNEQSICRSGYGREQLRFLAKKYHLIDGFDSYKATTEWESLRPSLISYIASVGKQYSRKLFWKEFILPQQAISFSFANDYKNILLLVQVYLVSPNNWAEWRAWLWCLESPRNKWSIQTHG